MNTKRNYIILSLAILAIGFGLVGITFAWYSYSNAESRVNATGRSDKPSVVFSQTEYIENMAIMPINDEDRYNYGTKNSFIVTVPEKLKNYDISIKINLVDIVMSSKLMINDFKYELLENGIIVSSGNFSNVVDNTIEIFPNKVLNVISYPTAYNYELIIWLSENNGDQNNIMNENFRAKINVISAVKKR